MAVNEKTACHDIDLKIVTLTRIIVLACKSRVINMIVGADTIFPGTDFPHFGICPDIYQEFCEAVVISFNYIN